MTASTRCLVPAATPDWPLITRETVGADTPARRAMSETVISPRRRPRVGRSARAVLAPGGRPPGIPPPKRPCAATIAVVYRADTRNSGPGGPGGAPARDTSPGRRLGAGLLTGQRQVQAVPLRVKADGEVSLAVQVPW